jgi:hypothetical protein
VKGEPDIAAFLKKGSEIKKNRKFFSTESMEQHLHSKRTEIIPYMKEFPSPQYLALPKH